LALTVKYLEGKKFQVNCRSHSIVIDQPQSSNGTDKGMNPVEIFAASLASCAAFYATTFLNRHIKSLNGLEIKCSWNYSDNPHRIGEISLNVNIPFRISESIKKGMLRSISNCTVKNSIEHTPKIVVNLN
jgi:uncharacterized OsmC-like protein